MPRSSTARATRIGKALAREVEKGRLDQARADALLARIESVGATSGGAWTRSATCGLVIEAIVEDLGVKRALLRRARAGRRARGDPRDQHVVAVGRRDRRGD